MKKLSWLLLAALPLSLLSCQKEVATSTSAANRTPSLLVANNVYYDGACEEECIDTQNPVYWEKSYGPAVYNVAQGSVSLKVYNTLTDIVYVFTGTQANIYSIQIVGEATKAYDGPAVTTKTITRSLPSEWEGCDNVSRDFIIRRNVGEGTGSGVSVSFSTSYDLIPNCDVPVDNCPPSGVTLTGSAIAVPVDAFWADITVTYTVTACDYAGVIKTQGGATAGSNQGATLGAYSGDDNNFGFVNTCSGASSSHYRTGPSNPLLPNPQSYPNVTNNNIVYSWTDSFTKGQCRTYTFTYRRAISGGEVVTGNWSCVGDGGELATHVPLEAAF